MSAASTPSSTGGVPGPQHPRVPARRTGDDNVVARRLAAVSALALAAAAIALGAALAADSVPRGLTAVGCLALALMAGWRGVTRRGAARVVWLGAAAALAIGVMVLAMTEQPTVVLLGIVSLWLSLAAARAAFRTHVALPAAPRPRRPVLFYNPLSGGGKAQRFHLCDEARVRGIQPVELTPGADLGTLARDAVAAGADALAMAGGDGSQATVAAVASEHGLPYACIPAGTRNHFALDLGVDRDDVVGALDAFVDGGERVVDLAEVNGRVFVNNVSLGLYAEAVQREGYRGAKLRTLLDTVPDVVSASSAVPALRWRDPRGEAHAGSAAILVSNNRYRLGHAVGSGTRPRIDDGLLGVAVVAAPRWPHRTWRQWAAPAFEIAADGSVAAGIDGEALRLAPPLRFRTRPRALRVRIAPTHPGASPSALSPDGAWAAVGALARIAADREPAGAPRVAASA